MNKKIEVKYIISWILLFVVLGVVFVYIKLSLTDYGFKGSIQRSIPQKWNGVYKEYYDNGKLKMETSYRFGKEHGLHKQYYEEGSINEIVEYQNGISIRGRRYYGTGELMSILSFRDGKADGVIKRYYKDGIFKGEIIMENGRWKEIKEYYNNGKLKLEESSEKHWRKEYDENGNLIKEGDLHKLRSEYSSSTD